MSREVEGLLTVEIVSEIYVAGRGRRYYRRRGWGHCPRRWRAAQGYRCSQRRGRG